MSEICIQIRNLVKVNERGRPLQEWICVPIDQEEFQEALNEIEAVEGEYFISASSTQNFDIPISPFTDLWELNDLMVRINEVDEGEHYKLAALIELEAPRDFDTIYRIIDHLDEYDFLSEIQDDDALGRYFMRHPNTLLRKPKFTTYKEVGWSMRLKYEIQYTSLGAIYRK